MGTVFQYISDDALEPISEPAAECQVCGSTGVDIFPYQGYWIKNGEDDEDDEDEEVIYEACERCIKSGNLRWMNEDELRVSFGAETILVEINRPDIVWEPGQDHSVKDGRRINRYREIPHWVGTSLTLIEKLRRTPQIPLMMQCDDWVVCCNDLCEFLGSPADMEALLELTDSATYWESGLGHSGRDFRCDGPPESFSEISEFRCFHCHSRYWIDQYT